LAAKHPEEQPAPPPQSGGVTLQGPVDADGDLVAGDKIVNQVAPSKAWRWAAGFIFLALVAAASAVIAIGPRLLSARAPLLTPMAFVAARPGETLLIIAAFDKTSANKGYDVPGRLYSLIAKKLPNSGSRVENYPAVIGDSAEARKLLETYGATVVIWGGYADGDAQANMELDKGKVKPAKANFDLATPESLQFKNVAVQASSLASFSLGLLQLNANAALAAGYFTTAIESARILGEAANPWEALMWRGNSHAWSNEWNLAIADYTEAIQRHPHQAGYSNRGWAYRMQGQYDLAIADYTQAIELDPQDAKTYNGRGESYSAQFKPDLALADYTRALELDPQYKKAYYNRAGAYSWLNKYDLAIADYTQAIKLDPQYKQAYFTRGLSYGVQGQLDLAVADYTQAIELDPQYKDPYNWRGKSYVAQGKSDLALADYTQAIKLDPRYETAYVNRGDLQADLHDFEAAIADYQAALRLIPDAYTYCALGLTYTKTGDWAAAVPMLEQGISRDAAGIYPWCKTALDNARQGTPTP
jgi:tetratricopeptide (TPR) repeat protein